MRAAGHEGERLVSGPRPCAGPANMRRGSAQKGAAITRSPGRYAPVATAHGAPVDVAHGAGRLIL